MEEQSERNLSVIKDEISKLANDIVSDDSVVDVEELLKISNALKSLTMKTVIKKPVDHYAPEKVAPKEFRCYLSEKLIQDPVILLTGYTYDRLPMENYLREGNTICPQSSDEITDPKLIPNRILKKLISKWCKENGIEFPFPSHETEARIDSLMATLPSCSTPDKKSAVKDLRILSERSETHELFSFRKELISTILQTLLPSENLEALDPEFHVDLVDLVKHLSEISEIVKLMGEHASVIPFLVKSLNEGPKEAKSSASASLCNLSELNFNKERIVEAGGVKGLTQLLQETEQEEAILDAAFTLVEICELDKKVVEKARREGLHKVVVQKMKEHRDFGRELLDVLCVLSKNDKVVCELQEIGAAPVLLRIVKETTRWSTLQIASKLFRAVMTSHEECKEIGEVISNRLYHGILAANPDLEVE